VKYSKSLKRFYEYSIYYLIELSNLMFSVSVKSVSFCSIHKHAYAYVCQFVVSIIIDVVALSLSKHSELGILRCDLYFYRLVCMEERGNILFLSCSNSRTSPDFSSQ
jgi:hypothetical protein